MPSHSLRAFVAIAPDPRLVPALAATQAELRLLPGGGLIRWTKPDQIHLTLRFLGNVPLDETPALIQRLQLACADFGPFPLEIAGLGCFPSPKRPRVIWIGLDGAIRSLVELQNTIARALSALGNPQDEKTFHPHLTLGRVRPGARSLGLDLSRLTVAPRLGPWQVKSVLLMRSELKPEGARHSLIFSQPLVETCQ
jgi:RNA 2',3'-cyclic 3'-phosphodiesterase